MRCPVRARKWERERVRALVCAGVPSRAALRAFLPRAWRGAKGARVSATDAWPRARTRNGCARPTDWTARRSGQAAPQRCECAAHPRQRRRRAGAPLAASWRRGSSAEADGATSALGLNGLAPATSASRLGPPLPHLHGDWAPPRPICAPGLCLPKPHLHWDWAHPCHICTETGSNLGGCQPFSAPKRTLYVARCTLYVARCTLHVAWLHRAWLHATPVACCVLRVAF